MWSQSVCSWLASFLQLTDDKVEHNHLGIPRLQLIEMSGSIRATAVFCSTHTHCTATQCMQCAFGAGIYAAHSEGRTLTAWFPVTHISICTTKIETSLLVAPTLIIRGMDLEDKRLGMRVSGRLLREMVENGNHLRNKCISTGIRG